MFNLELGHGIRIKYRLIRKFADYRAVCGCCSICLQNTTTTTTDRQTDSNALVILLHKIFLGIATKLRISQKIINWLLSPVCVLPVSRRENNNTTMSKAALFSSSLYSTSSSSPTSVLVVGEKH